MNVNRIAFTVFGKPMPKGSKTAIVRGAKAVLLDARRGPARKEYLAWHTAIDYAAWAWSTGNPRLPDDPTWDSPLDVRLRFFLPRPKSLPKKVLHHTKKPDVDKLVRAALDPMSGILFRDDSQVVRLVATKEYAAPGDAPRVEVSIAAYENGEKP